jgi:hypothetical protein
MKEEKSYARLLYKRIFILNSMIGNKIKIVDEEKGYVSDLEFVQYLGVLWNSKRIGKIKFAEAKIQKMLYELDKLEFNDFVINQILIVIKIQFCLQHNYLFSNGFVIKKQTQTIDRRTRRLIYNFIKPKQFQTYLFTHHFILED